jgi:hypothetical protein
MPGSSPGMTSMGAFQIQISSSQRLIRHCERSEAIHSFFLRQNGLLRCARNDGKIHLRILAAQFARGLPKNSCPLNRGRRECRAPDAPAAACAMVERKKGTRVSQVTPETPGIPRAMVYGLLRALPGDRALLPPSSLRSLLLKNLTPASRRQDHTTSPSASAPFVKGAIGVHRIPSRVRDDRDTPLEWDETT